MDIQITFRDGPIEAEVSAAEDEQYTEVLDALAEFVEEYDAVGPSEPQETSKSPEDDGTADEGAPTEDTEDNGSGKSNSLFDDVDATDSEIQRVLKTGRVEDGDIKEYPEIIGDTDLLGDSSGERLLNGAIILLSTLEAKHGISQCKTSDLKDALKESGMNDDNWGNIRRQDNKDVYLNLKGKGPSATTTLRAPGKEDAHGKIQVLVDDLREDGDDDE